MNIKLILNFCLWILIAFTACKSTSKIHKAIDVPKSETGFYEIYSHKLGYELNGSEEMKFIKSVDEWLGVPYKYGGCTKDGTDCSCFVSCFYQNVYGISLPRRSEDMKLQSKTIEKEALKQGDLVFFKITGEKISHVGIYISKGFFVHATTSKGVMINSLDENYYKKYFLTAGRIER
jgi:hypothetical protein